MIHAKRPSMPVGLGDKAFTFFVYVITLLVAFICFYPLFFTVIASLSDPYSVYTGGVSFWPVGFTLDAYSLVLQNSQIWTGYRNTIFYTVAGTLFNLALTIPCAYALSKTRLYGRSLLTTFFLVVMYFSGGMIPTYLLFKDMGLINTPWVMVIAGGLNVYNMVVARVYFQNSIPESLYEASRIDGTSEMGIFFRIALPLSGPIIAVIALYYAVAHWNDYFTAMLYVTKTKYQPLALVLRRILILNETAYSDALASDATAEALESAAKRAYMAATMRYALVFISSLPMLIIYPFVQRFFVKGVMIGSLKG